MKMTRHQRILNRIKELAEQVANEPYTKGENANPGWLTGKGLLEWIEFYESIYTE